MIKSIFIAYCAVLLCSTGVLLSCTIASRPERQVRTLLPDDGEEARLLQATHLVGVNTGMMSRIAVGVVVQLVPGILEKLAGRVATSYVSLERARREAAGEGIFDWHYNKTRRVALSVHDLKTLRQIVQAAWCYNTHLADFNAVLRSEAAATARDEDQLKALRREAAVKLDQAAKTVVMRTDALNNLPPSYRAEYKATLEPLLREKENLEVQLNKILISSGHSVKT